MSALTCCFWWFILGVLVGWVLNWLLRSVMYREPVANSHAQPVPASPPAAAGGVNLLAAAAAGFAIRGDDDLQVVEGIGPKIKGLLNAKGIHTFAQLAKTPVAQIQTILDEAGPRFKLANPGTWPQQAQLAAENRWTELKTLQDELDGGV